MNTKHHKGLYLLFFVEMWERFSYYGMRALIVLYMIESLAFSAQKAGNIYGIYTGLVYLTPLIGGYLADRYFGQRKFISAGAFLMFAGLLTLASGKENLFYFSLFLMIAANGCFKSNISSLLGLLYENENDKKDSAFTIFYMGINIGALLSPLICGTLAVKYGYRYGFLAAGIGMAAGLLMYLLLQKKFLGDCGTMPQKEKTPDCQELKIKNIEKLRLKSLIIIMFFAIPFWICFEQAGTSLTLFAQYATDRRFPGIEIPTGYFQSLNPLFIIILAPCISMFWDYLRKKSKEPASAEKFAAALLLMSFSFLIMTVAGHYSLTGKVSPLWLICAYFIMTVAELCLSPVGLSLVSKLAPKNFLSLMTGCWFITSFFGNSLAGFFGGKYETTDLVNLFGSFAGISFVSFIILLFFIPMLNRVLKN